MTLITPDRLAPPRPRPHATPDGSIRSGSYWKRLREPDALVERDLDSLHALKLRTPLLDVGCGNGAFVRACIDAGIEATGIEAFSTSSKIARSRGAPVIRGAGEALPIASSSFDAVRLKEVLEHVQSPLVMAREMRRVLRPGGTFLIYVPTQWSQLYPFPANFWDDYTHVRPFSRLGLMRLLEDAGFTHINIEGYTPPLKAWQRPIGAVASRVFPFLWRATARNGSELQRA